MKYYLAMNGNHIEEVFNNKGIAEDYCKATGYTMKEIKG